MKFRMLSLLSIILALTVKSMEISAKDYNELRVFVNAIPSTTTENFMAYRLENKLDSIVFHIIQTSTVTDVFESNTNSLESDNSFTELIKIASENELNALLAHQSAPVKVYAYRALISQSMNVNSDFELALFSDTSCVNRVSGDKIIPSTVRDVVENDLRIFN